MTTGTLEEKIYQRQLSKEGLQVLSGLLLPQTLFVRDAILFPSLRPASWMRRQK